MKSIITTLLIIACSIAQAQKPRTVKAKLDAVTVYLKGATLYYNEKVSLAPGNNTFVFEGISPYINASTANASCIAGAVMDVRHQIRYKETVKNNSSHKYDKQIEQVLDSIESFGYAKKDYDNKLNALSLEKNMLLSNRIIKGNYQKDSLQLLESAMNLLRKKLADINAQELKYDKAKAQVQKTLNHLNNRHRTLELLKKGGGKIQNPNNAEPIHQLVVNIYAKAAVYTTVSLNYFTQNAHWLPSYDLQASSETSKLEMKYFAGVVQNSGLDWDNAKLTISTSSPSQNNTKPSLIPWQLSFLEFKRKMQNIQSGISNSVFSLKKESLSFDSKNDELTKDAASLIDYINVSENLIRTEYEIKLKYTINANGQSHKVLINEGTMPMDLEFAAVPKLSTDAFLLAKITDWENMNIIPGRARIYLDNSFAGEMFLDAFTDEDTLKVSLGTDKSIALTRKKIKEKIKTKFLDGEKVETRTIEILVKNMKNRTVEIEVEDQIPIVLGTEEIKVVLIDGDGATLNEENGSLKWKVKLKAKKREKIKFTYEIRYPKNKRIAGL